jgi:hypothetical protein
VGAASVGAASVGAASVGAASVGAASVGAASVGAASAATVSRMLNNPSAEGFPRNHIKSQVYLRKRVSAETPNDCFHQ